MAVSPSSATIDALIGFCRRELAAVESYRQSLSSLNPGTYTPVLAKCLRSHEQRAEFFKSRLRALQAEPPPSAGMLGTFMRIVEGAAAAISPRVAIAALQEEEELLLRHYRGHVGDLDSESQQEIRRSAMPAQLETQTLMNDLRHGERAPTPST